MKRTTTPTRGRHRRPTAAIVVAALLLGGIGAGVSAPALAAAPATVIGDFESTAEGWGGVAAGGADASFELVADATAPRGSQVARIAFADPAVGYYELYRTVPSLELDRLTFAIKAPGLERIVVRVIDGNGRAHQTGHALDGSADWQTITVDDPTSGTPYYTWGGDPGVTGYADPLTQVSLIVDTGFAAAGAPAGMPVLIDDVRVTGPAPVVVDPPGVPTLIGGFESGAEGWISSGDADASFARVAVADAPEGGSVGRIDLADTTSGLSELVRSAPGLSFGALVFDIRAPGLSRIVVRLVDVTGRVHQTSYPLDGSADWQTVIVDDPVTGPNHVAWGGVDGAGWQDPLDRLSLLVDTGFYDSSAWPTASVEFDRVRVFSEPQASLLSSIALGNVFVGDAEAAIGYDSDADALRWRVTDLAGVLVDEGEIVGPDGAGQLVLAIDGGWYRLDVTEITGGEVVGAASTTLARIPGHEAAEDSPFGVATHYGGWWSTDSLPLVSAAGIATIRDEIYWSAVETTQGVYDWTVDAWTDAVAAEGLGLLLIPGYGNQYYDGGDKPLSAEAVAAYTAYAAALTERYRDLLVGVEIWNEWDISIGGTSPGTAADYVSLLDSASPAVRSAAPELPIIGPAVALLSTSFLEQTLQGGALEHVDGIVMHPYSYPASAEALDATLREVDALVREYNEDSSLPLWVTEHGWPTGTDVRAISEREQASNLTKSAAIAVAHDLEHYFWYDFVNDGTHEGETESNFGLVHDREDELGAYTPKPAYVAYATAIARLDAAEFVERDETVPGLWDLVYRTDGVEADLRVLWADEPTSLRITAEGPVTVTSQLGATIASIPHGGGVVVVPLDEEPVYVEGVVAAIEADASSLMIDAAYVGRPLEVAWTADNRGSASATSFGLVVEGLDEPVTQLVEADSVGTVTFALPAPTATGPIRVTGALERDGVAAGILTADAVVAESLALTGAHAFTAEGEEVLRLRVTNHAEDPVELADVAWSAGDEQGEAGVGVSIAARSTVAIDVPVSAPTAPVAWSATATTVDAAQAAASGTLRPADEVGEIPAGAIVVDGVIDEPGATPSASLSIAGGDLTAEAWYRWQPEGLSLSAVVADDVHLQDWSGGEIWRGDSLQFTFAAGAPGESPRSHEFGVALTPDGVQVHRWLPASVAGAVTGASAVVVRDEVAGTTTYEVLIPWSQLDGWDPADGLMSTSIAINENDGSGRTWAEWGGGIAGSKDASLFRAMRTMPPEAQPSVVLDLGSVAAGGTVHVGGTGFAPGETVEIVLHSDPVLLAEATADSVGAFAASVVVPGSTPAGAHTLVVTGAASGLRAEASLTVTPAWLTVTGSTTVTIAVGVLLALLLIVVGMALRPGRVAMRAIEGPSR